MILIALHEFRRKNMRLCKLLAMFLTLSMLVSIVPTAAFAKETGSEPSGESEVPAVVNPNNVFLNKTATLKENGTHTIDLEAYATGHETTVVKPADIVLVLDHKAVRFGGGYSLQFSHDDPFTGSGRSIFRFGDADMQRAEH